MPSEESYHAVLKALSEMAENWRVYRDTINRAINLLNHEVLSLAQRFDTDDKNRAERQQQIDAKMEKIIVGQEQIKRLWYIRVTIEIAAILIVIAFVFGASR